MGSLKALRRPGAILVSLLMLALVSVPLVARSADHLDAPGVTSPGGRGEADINDLYVFEGDGIAVDRAAREDSTIVALTTNPAAGALSPAEFARDVLYQIKIDVDGDAIEDISYKFRFSQVREKTGNQKVMVRHATGDKARSQDMRGELVAIGQTNKNVRIKCEVDGRIFTGLVSDPFFFDLDGFLGSVEGADNGRMLNDGDENDPFATFNAMAIVLEVPNSQIGGNDTTVGIWATTSVRTNGKWVQTDRMGRPAINTVVNSSGPLVGADSDAKNVFNSSHPKNDVADFTTAVVDALQIYSSLDSEGPYSDEQAELLAGVLLPDVVTYTLGSAAAGPLNGRALTDDVIDIELRIVTGGDPLELFDDRDADGGINTDGIGPHSDYRDVFPFLGLPH